jgi:hypothetical protein
MLLVVRPPSPATLTPLTRRMRSSFSCWLPGVASVSRKHLSASIMSGSSGHIRRFTESSYALGMRYRYVRPWDGTSTADDPASDDLRGSSSWQRGKLIWSYSTDFAVPLFRDILNHRQDLFLHRAVRVLGHHRPFGQHQHAIHFPPWSWRLLGRYTLDGGCGQVEDRMPKLP